MRVKLDDGAILPLRAHPTDAGLDLYAPMTIKDQTIIFPGHSVMIDTGVHPELPKGHVGLVMTRSSMNAWDLHCEGVIDEKRIIVVVLVLDCLTEVLIIISCGPVTRSHSL